MTTITKYTIDYDEELSVAENIDDNDYNVFTRNDDEDADVMILKHDLSKSLIDIYIYDKLSMNEQRFVCIYNKIVSLEYKIDHNKGRSTIMIIFDDGTNICSFQSCPIQFSNVLINKLFSKN